MTYPAFYDSQSSGPATLPPFHPSSPLLTSSPSNPSMNVSPTSPPKSQKRVKEKTDGQRRVAELVQLQRQAFSKDRRRQKGKNSANKTTSNTSSGWPSGTGSPDTMVADTSNNQEDEQPTAPVFPETNAEGMFLLTSSEPANQAWISPPGHLFLSHYETILLPFLRQVSQAMTRREGIPSLDVLFDLLRQMGEAEEHHQRQPTTSLEQLGVLERYAGLICFRSSDIVNLRRELRQQDEDNQRLVRELAEAQKLGTTVQEELEVLRLSQQATIPIEEEVKSLRQQLAESEVLKEKLQQDANTMAETVMVAGGRIESLEGRLTTQLNLGRENAAHLTAAQSAVTNLGDQLAECKRQAEKEKVDRTEYVDSLLATSKTQELQHAEHAKMLRDEIASYQISEETAKRYLHQQEAKIKELQDLHVHLLYQLSREQEANSRLRADLVVQESLVVRAIHHAEEKGKKPRMEKDRTLINEMGQKMMDYCQSRYEGLVALIQQVANTFSITFDQVPELVEGADEAADSTAGLPAGLVASSSNTGVPALKWVLRTEATTTEELPTGANVEVTALSATPLATIEIAGASPSDLMPPPTEREPKRSGSPLTAGAPYKKVRKLHDKPEYVDLSEDQEGKTKDDIVS